jgi:molybdopterin molybdotransferase
VILLAGGTGPGSDDAAAEALAAAGTLAIHGCALQPGETAGLGRTAAGVPVFLLPGTPVACLWAYEMLAGRAVRRRGGRDPALPFPTLSMTLARKLVSTIGTTEIHPVRRCGRDAVEQAETFSETGLAAASRADGFVIVPAESEGVAEGAVVTVHLYEPRAPDAAGPVGAAG